MTFTDVGHPEIDILLDNLSPYKDIVGIEYPLDSFVVDGTLFIVYTRNKETAIKSYSTYKEEIANLNKELERIYKSIDTINNKFCNENWLTKCPKDIIDKEYEKLCYMEKKADALVDMLISKTYILSNIKVYKK